MIIYERGSDKRVLWAFSSFCVNTFKGANSSDKIR